MKAADYQLTFEPIDPLFILGNSVGPYSDGQPSPSGTLDPITVPNLSAGSVQTINVKALRLRRWRLSGRDRH